MLNVFLTVDTEIWPYVHGWPVKPLPADKTDYTREVDAYIFGKTEKGTFGLPFQMDILDKHGLRGVYFIEALFASVAGIETLARIVELVQGRGHEVQLHIHTEWLSEIARPELPAKFRQHIRQFSEDEQTAIIAHGLANLRAAGARDVCAFRAGNYGANRDTLRALARNGIRFDTSYNACYLDSACGIRTDDMLVQPVQLDGVHEFPVTVFNDYPGHLRHAQLCACSFGEMRHALMEAWRSGWHSFVIVLHGFELMRKFNEADEPTVPDRINIRRYERLCGFLAEHPDKFRSAVFSEIDTLALPRPGPLGPLQSRVPLTMVRWAEQLAGRFA